MGRDTCSFHKTSDIDHLWSNNIYLSSKLLSVLKRQFELCCKRIKTKKKKIRVREHDLIHYMNFRKLRFIEHMIAYKWIAILMKGSKDISCIWYKYVLVVNHHFLVWIYCHRSVLHIVWEQNLCHVNSQAYSIFIHSFSQNLCAWVMGIKYEQRWPTL